MAECCLDDIEKVMSFFFLDQSFKALSPSSVVLGLKKRAKASLRREATLVGRVTASRR